MTQACSRAHGVETPSFSQLSLAAMLRACMELVLCLACLLRMRLRRHRHACHMRATPDALPADASDISEDYLSTTAGSGFDASPAKAGAQTGHKAALASLAPGLRREYGQAGDRAWSEQGLAAIQAPSFGPALSTRIPGESRGPEEPQAPRRATGSRPSPGPRASWRSGVEPAGLAAIQAPSFGPALSPRIPGSRLSPGPRTSRRSGVEPAGLAAIQAPSFGLALSPRIPGEGRGPDRPQDRSRATGSRPSPGTRTSRRSGVEMHPDPGCARPG
jgi:hypothetical protein